MLQAIMLFAKYLSAIKQLISIAEELFPNVDGVKYGSFKLEFVKQALVQLDNGITQAWPYIDKLISILVVQFNAAKILMSTKTTTDNGSSSGNS